MFTLKIFPELDANRFTDKTVVLPCLPNGGAPALITATKALSDSGMALVNPRIIPVQGDAGLGFDLVCFTLRKQLIDPDSPPPNIKQPLMLMAFLAGGNSPYTGKMGWAIRDTTRGDQVIDLSRGYPLFTPTDPLDHAATQYHACAAPTPARERQLLFVTLMPAAGDCSCTVQDEKFRTILRITLTKEGREVHQATLPPDSSKLRVVFECPSVAATPLPTQIRVYEVPE